MVQHIWAYCHRVPKFWIFFHTIFKGFHILFKAQPVKKTIVAKHKQLHVATLALTWRMLFR